MFYDVRITPEQLKAAAAWAQAGDGMAAVELAADDRMLVAEQGDEINAWDHGGEPGTEEYLAVAPLCEHARCENPEPHRRGAGCQIGVEPLAVPEALTLNNTDQDPLILAAEAILGELAGRIDEDDADGYLFHEACDAWDAWRRTATRLAMAAGKTPDAPEPVGRPTDDPRYQRGAH